MQIINFPISTKYNCEVLHKINRAEIHCILRFRLFQTAEQTDGNEQDLVNALRKSSSFIPELSLAAEINGKIAGHIMFTRLQIGGHTALALAPLSVLPDYQRQGMPAHWVIAIPLY